MKLKKLNITKIIALCSIFGTASSTAAVVSFDFDEITGFDNFSSGSTDTTGAFIIAENGTNGMNAAVDANAPFIDDGGFIFTGPPAAGVNSILQITSVAGGAPVQFTLTSINLNAGGPGGPGAGVLTIEALDASGAVIFAISDTAGTPDFTTYTNTNATLITSLRVSSTVSINTNRIDAICIDPILVPEPSSTALLGLGFAGLALRRRR